MLQAPLTDGLSLDLLSLFQDPGTASVIDVGGCQVAEALVVSAVVVVVDEGANLPFQVAGQEVVFQQNPVLHSLMPALDLALGLRVMRGATNMAHAPVLKIIG